MNFVVAGAGAFSPGAPARVTVTPLTVSVSVTIRAPPGAVRSGVVHTMS